MIPDDGSEALLCLPPQSSGFALPRRLPDGACDSHIHVFGPRGRYPLAASRGYTPHPLTFEDYRPVMAALGIDRAVLVQPSVYGQDNAALLDTLAREPGRLRGVVVVPPEIPDAELDRLHGLGVRGVRINRRNPGGLGLDALETLGRRIADRGWHVQLQIELANAVDLAALAARAPVPLVIDHLGFPDPVAGVAAPEFQSLLRVLESGRIWVKLSAPYRISRQGAPYRDVAPLIEALLAARPDRLLWASDWPHTELFETMPDDAELLATSPLWSARPDIRQAVFVDNPAALYWS